MSLRANVVAAIVTAMAALIATVILLEDPLIEHRQMQLARTDLHEAATTARDAIARGEDPDRVSDRLGAERVAHLTIFGSDRAILGDTAADGDDLARVAAPSELEVQRALERGPRGSVETRDGRSYVQVMVRGPGATVVRAARPTATMIAAQRATRELLIVGGVIAAGAAVLLALALTRTMVRPVEELTRTADALAEGKLDARTRSQREDELGRLGRALDRMADQLGERIARLRSEEARLTATLEGMVEGVFVTDARGRIVRTNRAFERLAPTAPGGRTVVEAIRSAELHEAVGRALAGEASSVELEAHVGGEVRALSAQVAPLPEKGGVVAVLHDVTDLKRADRVRRDFVANASHELRTPLTAIRGYAETLQAGAIEDRETAKRFVDTIARHATRLQELVDDLLVLSRAESVEEPLELEPVDVREVVRQAVSAIESQASAKHVDLRIEVDEGLPQVIASAWGLDHVVLNLVDNAVKYTPDGGTVWVRSRVDTDAVVLEVADTGPGIPQSSAERVFERFYRVDKGRGRERGGTGLGLAIVKHLVTQMGAEIELESTPGRGATFRLRMSTCRRGGA